MSAATNVASYGEVGVFLQDLASGETVSVSTTLGPLARPAGSSPPVAEISSDGSTLAFEWPSFFDRVLATAPASKHGELLTELLTAARAIDATVGSLCGLSSGNVALLRSVSR